MKYLYFDPTISSINYGDYLIDYALRRFIARVLPGPTARADPRSGKVPQGEYDFALLPGVTLFGTKQPSVLDAVQRAKCPVFALSGAYWVRRPARAGMIRSLVFGLATETPNLSLVRLLATPIGARDSFTLRTLRNAGIEARYTGCVTLQLESGDQGDDGYLLFSFGRHNLREQVRAGRQLGRRHTVVGICHERGEYERVVAAGWELPLVTFHGDVEMYLSYFRRARIVITGRLHGVLPSLAFRKKVFYFGDRDTRTTLLDDLGVPIHEYHEIAYGRRKASPAFNTALISRFRDALVEVLESAKESVAKN